MSVAITDDPIGRLEYAGEIRHFMLGGNATFTLVEGDERFTYQVKSAKRDREKNWSTGNQDKSKYFVSLLTGPSNTSDYQYMGMLNQNIDGAYQFGPTKASKITSEAKSFQLLTRLWRGVEHACVRPPMIEFWHEGHCCMCGRRLTVPESIASGIGPECASKE